MATDRPNSSNLMDELLDEVRAIYVEQEGEEPPEAFMQDARRKILKEVAQRNRDEHREIYDALADE